jgi:pSer/pThr/pTyr-binding forkhead associated (FHA) protein
VLPERYSRVSKKHCVIERGIEGIRIVDLESTNGTFLNGRPLKVLNPIMHGDTVILGGPSAGNKLCTLRFEVSESASHQTAETEVWEPG